MIARFGESGKKRVRRRILKHSGHKNVELGEVEGGVRVQKSEMGNNICTSLGFQQILVS